MNGSTLEIIDGEKSIVHIEGAATIDSIAEIHHIFQEALNHHLPLIIDLENATEFDSSFIQLVRSLCYTLNNGGHPPLQFVQKIIPEKLMEIIRISGFQFHPMCTRSSNAECVSYKIANSLLHIKETPQ